MIFFNPVTRSVLLFSFITFTSISNADTGHDPTVDDDGCWDGRHSFINGGSSCFKHSTSTWLNENKLKVVYKNTCSDRIYAKYCNGKTNGISDCGAAGVRPGGTKSWVTYNATGDYSYIAVGSDISSKDWVCASRWGGPNWKNLGK